MRTILITAFEPFGGETINPSEMVLGMLPDEIGGYSIRKLVLPVEHDRSVKIAAAEYDKLQPAALIMLGQAGGRRAITPETTAKATVDSGGEHETLCSTLPVERIVDALTVRGIQCERSDDAGTYVCNTLFYRMLEHNGGEVPTGFVHVPYIREQGHADKPFMEIADIQLGVETIIETVADQSECK